MKEETEEEFYRGLTREFKKRNDDCIAKQHLLYPNWERDWENSLFDSFPPSDSLYTSTKEQGEREKLGKIIVSLFSVFSVRHIRRGQYGEREKLGKIIVSLLSIFPVHRITSKKIFHKVWSKVFEVEESESVISFSKLLTWFSQ